MGPIDGSGYPSVTPRGFADLTDVTLADDDTNSILTDNAWLPIQVVPLGDNANRAIQGNVAMQVTQPGGKIATKSFKLATLGPLCLWQCLFKIGSKIGHQVTSFALFPKLATR